MDALSAPSWWNFCISFVEQKVKLGDLRPDTVMAITRTLVRGTACPLTCCIRDCRIIPPAGPA